MGQINIQDEITIEAPIKKVWAAIKNPEIQAKWHPFVTHIGGEHKLGALRKCDVFVEGKAGQTEERCSLYKEGEKIAWQVEKDTSGFSNLVTDWVGGFILVRNGSNSTIVTAQSTFKPKNLFVSLMTPFIRMKFHQAQRKILAGLKGFVLA